MLEVSPFDLAKGFERMFRAEVSRVPCNCGGDDMGAYVDADMMKAMVVW
jgi:hypothetical protein